MRALLLLALMGCTRHEDPCAGVVGPCVGVHLDSEVVPIDQLRITLNGGASRFTPETPANIALPVRFAVTLPASAGSAHLDFAGLQSPRTVSSASADVPLGASGHADISVTLRAPATPPDLAGVDLSGADLTELPDLTAIDLAGADLTELQDLAPERDLAVVYPLAVSVSGTGGGTVTVDGAACVAPCTVFKPAGATVTIVAVPAGGSLLVATTGDCSSTSTTCTFTINGPSTINANFKSATLSMLQVVPVPVSVNVAQLSVAPSPAPAATCGTNCYLYPTGTSVALSWTLVSGQFLGWGGVSPACRNAFTCNVKVDNDMGVTVSYSDSVPNYAFVTSVTYGTGQLNAAGTPQATADGFCQSQAMAAGLTDFASFKAWLSVTGVPAASRLAGARGWVRIDGLPFADNITTTTAAGSPYYPLSLDQNGALPNTNVWTGTSASGNATTNCTDWTDATAGSGVVGLTLDGGPGWTAYTAAGCNTGAALYCFGTARNFALSFTAPKGARHAFLTSAQQTGADDADTLCQMEGTGNGFSGKFRAWRNRTATTGVSIFDQTLGPWVRLDNVLVAPIASQALLDGMTAQQLAPVHQQANGVYADITIPAWIGSSTNNCLDWTSLANMGNWLNATRYRTNTQTATCTANARWYCFQE